MSQGVVAALAVAGFLLFMGGYWLGCRRRRARVVVGLGPECLTFDRPLTAVEAQRIRDAWLGRGSPVLVAGNFVPGTVPAPNGAPPKAGYD